LPLTCDIELDKLEDWGRVRRKDLVHYFFLELDKFRMGLYTLKQWLQLIVFVHYRWALPRERILRVQNLEVGVLVFPEGRGHDGLVEGYLLVYLPD